ncbi:MAG: glycoside hydrolase family 99-like domain-containing protein, partial [Bradyrhizobium sp.]
MKTGARKGHSYDPDVVDEGDLSSSLADLTRPPRLRGQLVLATGRLTGWLLDARAPLSGLDISLTADGKTIATAVTSKRTRRPLAIDPRHFEALLTWTSDISRAKLIAVHVVCPDGERYELFIGGTPIGEDGNEADADMPAAGVQQLAFGGSPTSSAPAPTAAENVATVESAADSAVRSSAAPAAHLSQPDVVEPKSRASSDVPKDINREKAEDVVSPLPAPDQGAAKAPRHERRTAVRAYVDALQPNLISGWAWDEADPSGEVEIFAFAKQVLVAQGIARNMRQDLKDAGVGTGKYGFVLNLPSCNVREVSLQAKRNGEILPVTIPAELLAAAPAATARVPAVSPTGKPSFEGHVDRLTRWGAVGWAWLPQYPNEAAIVEAVHGGSVIGRTIANRMREDLAAHGKGTGKYGFELSFDAPVEDDVVPEFRILEPSAGLLPNESPLPPRSESERKIQGRGSIDDLYAEQAKFTSAGDAFEEFDSSILERADHSSLDIIAYYLPQFHAIKENDRFWGKGFTEWRQLGRGLPRYRGHYQPRTPRDLGFYTLTDIEPITRQAALAKAAGVNVFGFYYYWFNRTRVLDEPVEVFLRSGVEMKFMLIWANENWTRTWDGSESAVLLKQDYSEADERALIADWVRHFQDRRYYTIDGRPLFVIYNPRLIPDPQKTIARWRRILETEHDLNPLIFMSQTFGMRDPRVFGLDGAIEFPPHKLSDTLPGRPLPDAYSPDFAGRVIEYDDFVRVSLEEKELPYDLIKTAVPSWDNESRRPNRGFSLELSTPKKFEAWMTGLADRALTGRKIGGRNGRSIVAVNAWNEWAEGAYLEPDVHFGAAYLNAAARAIRTAVGNASASISAQAAEPTPSVSVIFPNYNHAKFLPERIGSVLNQTLKPAEIIFLDDCSSDDSIEVARSLLEKSHIPYKIIPNKKNSGNVFKQWMKGLSEAKFDLVWIAETDDSVDQKFLECLAPLLRREDVLAAFGKISFIDGSGKKSNDLAGYF